jgi:hypothetical protein
MSFKDIIFDSFKIAKDILSASEPAKGTGNYNIFSNNDPFDFYRKIKKSDGYIPVTQRGLRKAFTRGIAGIEFFIEMATSLRPLADEAQNIDEITRLLSQQKLTTNPNLHSVTILRNLIKDQNPEIALYAAEGLNTIENAFIEKIQRIKDRIKENNKSENITETTENNDTDYSGQNDIDKDNGKKIKQSIKEKKKYILYYLLGLLYYKFAKLLHGQHLIQLFYLKEAISSLKAANEINQNNKRVLTKLGESYMLIGRNKTAIKIFTYLFSGNKKDRVLLMKLAECYYNTGDYQNVVTLANLAAKSAIELDEISNLIIYQWLLNI